jgi:hypothetical protein
MVFPHRVLSFLKALKALKFLIFHRVNIAARGLAVINMNHGAQKYAIMAPNIQPVRTLVYLVGESFFEQFNNPVEPEPFGVRRIVITRKCVIGYRF